MMVKPSVTDLLKKVDNRFELVVATAKRARQLSKGEKPLTNKEEESTVTLAADEIAEGKVTIAQNNVENNVTEDIEELELIEENEIVEDIDDEVVENIEDETVEE